MTVEQGQTTVKRGLSDKEREQRRIEKATRALVREAERKKRRDAATAAKARHKFVGDAWDRRAASLPPHRTKTVMDLERAEEDKRVQERLDRMRKARTPKEQPKGPPAAASIIKPLTARQRHKLLKESALTPQEARIYAAEIGRLYQPDEVVIAKPQSWTAEYVGFRMVEAFTVLRMLPINVGHGRIRSCMPAYRNEFDAAMATKTLRAVIEPPKVLVVSSEEMLRCDEALAWPMQFLHGLEDDFMARAVTVGALWRSTGQSIASKCKKFGVSRGTFYDRMRAGHTIIAVHLIANMAPVT